MDDPLARARFPMPDVRTSDGWGHAPRRLSADPGFIRISRSLWAERPSALPADQDLSTWERAALLQRAMGADLLIAHLSAAQLWGLPITQRPVTWMHQLLGEQVRQPDPVVLPELACAGDRRNPSTGHFLLRTGLGLQPSPGPWHSQVTNPVETLLKCLPWLPGWRAVAAVDHVRAFGNSLIDRRAPVALSHIQDALASMPGRPAGRAVLRRALSRSAARTWSPMETFLRLAVISRGLPAPAMNLSLALPSGRTVYLDLAWEDARVGLEYNGRVHYENRDVYGDEHHRLNQLADAGWRVRVVVVDDLRDPQRFADLILWLRRGGA